MGSSSTESIYFRAFQVALVVRNPPANAGDTRGTGSIPGFIVQILHVPGRHSCHELQERSLRNQWSFQKSSGLERSPEAARKTIGHWLEGLVGYLAEPGCCQSQFSTVKEEETSLLTMLNPSGSFRCSASRAPVPVGQSSQTPNLKAKGQLLPIGFVLTRIYSLLLL